jgi:hypothetical protein
MDSYLNAVEEAESWYDVLQRHLVDLKSAEELLAMETDDPLSGSSPLAGPSGTQTSTPLQSRANSPVQSQRVRVRGRQRHGERGRGRRPLRSND